MCAFKQKIYSFTTGLCMVLMVFGSTVVYAVHDTNVFELDNGIYGSNAFDESTIADPGLGMPDDWARTDDVAGCPGGATSCGYVAGPHVDPLNPGGDADRSLFVGDPLSGLDSIFTGGGSKDDLDMDGWQHTLGSPPDKDDLGPVTAAAYSSLAEPLTLYFSGGLLAENGDSSIGTWLLKQKTGLCTSGTHAGHFGTLDEVANDGSCTSLAHHQVGDIFTVSENTNGGTVTNITVFMWVGEGGPDAPKIAACLAAAPSGDCTLEPPKRSLARLATLSNATCKGELVNDLACGNMNQVDTESPDTWGYFPKSSPDLGPASPAGTDGIDADDFPAYTYFEGGVAVSAIFEELGCFSSFLMNTRTSASVRSQLKDVAVGDFELCKLEMTKAPDIDALCTDQGGNVDYTYVVRNLGIAVLDVVIGDDAATVDDGDNTNGDETADDFDVIDEATGGAGNTTMITLEPGESNVDIGVLLVVTINHTGASGSLINTATATGTGPFGAEVQTTAQATVLVESCSIEVDKSVDLSAVCNQNSDVVYTYKVRNTGSADLTNIVLKDDIFFSAGNATYTLANLAAGSGWHTFAVLNETPVGDGTFPFGHTNTVTATADAIANVSVDDTDTATVTLHKCDISIIKNCTAEIGPDVDLPFFGTITNEGTTPIVITFLRDNNEENSVQDVTPVAVNLAAGATTTYADMYFPNQVTGTHIDTIQVKANAFDGQTQVTEVIASDTAGVDPECRILTNPTIQVTKNCTPTNVAGADILFGGTATNIGDVNLENVAITDTYLQANGTLTTVAVVVSGFDGLLAKDGGSVNYSGSYTPHFTWNKNVVTASGDDVITSAPTSDWAQAICQGCPFVGNPTSTGDTAGSQGTFDIYVDLNEAI